jgi:tetratricopeptide (TPR) repeat protein
MLKKKLNAKTEARLQEMVRRGHALEKSQRFDEAAAEYQKVLDIDPGNIAACQLLGLLWHKQGQNDLAEPLLAKVVKVFPRKADLQCAYGAVLSATGDHRKSSLYYRKALDLDPEYLIAQYNLSQELMYLGETEAAIAGYRRAVEISPLCAAAYQQLARLCKFTEYDEDVKVMEQLYAQLEGEDRKLLAFGLSVVHKKLGNFQQSFDYLLEANRLHRTTLDYDTAQTEATFSELRQAFNAEVLARPVEPADSDLAPIFILGMPRSGTSLAEQILASHSAVHGCGELKNLTVLYKNTFTENGDLVEQVASLSPGRRREMAQQYLDAVGLMANGKLYATDKMPHNFLLVGMIADLFPNARIIHCERNPLDTCFSIFTNLFTGIHSYAYQLEELGHYYLLYQQLMAHWYEVLPGRIYTLNYERMVAETESEVRKLLDFCGLPFEAGCLSFFETERAVITVSNTQVRQPIYNSSVEGWRKFEAGLAPLRAILGV